MTKFVYSGELTLFVVVVVAVVVVVVVVVAVVVVVVVVAVVVVEVVVVVLLWYIQWNRWLSTLELMDHMVIVLSELLLSHQLGLIFVAVLVDAHLQLVPLQ